jgi:hypothetical protein
MKRRIQENVDGKEVVKMVDLTKERERYLILPLKDFELDVQVKIEDEGIVIDVFNIDGDVVNTMARMWDELPVINPVLRAEKVIRLIRHNSNPAYLSKAADEYFDAEYGDIDNV